MITYSDIIKQSKSYQIIEQDIKSDRLAHSYMLINDDKQTLYSFMKVMAQAIYCETHNACGECNVCQRIEDDNFTNITTLTSDTAIKVDDIKNLVMNTFLASLENGKKLYIIADAERINEAGQNKLLKTLEEPSQNVIFILGVTNENAMLPTIRSRCKKVHLNVWNEQAIYQELTKHSDDADKINLAAKFSSGSISRAMAIMQDEEFKQKYNNVMKVLTEYSGSSDLAGYLNIFGKDKEEIISHLGILESVISTLSKDANAGIPLDGYPIRVLANIYDLVIDSYKRFNANCTAQNVMYNLLMKLAEVKYKLG